MRIKEKALGPEHADVGATLNNMANVRKKQGKLEEAMELFKKALAIKPEDATYLNNLADVYFLQVL